MNVKVCSYLFFLDKGCPGLEHSQESVYSQKRDWILELREFLDSKTSNKEFHKNKRN